MSLDTILTLVSYFFVYIQVYLQFIVFLYWVYFDFLKLLLVFSI